jgi:truncated hemoglobin YjbI
VIRPAVGGALAFETLTLRFYDKVRADPALAPVSEEVAVG